MRKAHFRLFTLTHHVVVGVGRTKPRLLEERRVDNLFAVNAGDLRLDIVDGEVPVRQRELWVDSLQAVLEGGGNQGVADQEAEAVVELFGGLVLGKEGKKKIAVKFLQVVGWYTTCGGARARASGEICQSKAPVAMQPQQHQRSGGWRAESQRSSKTNPLGTMVQSFRPFFLLLPEISATSSMDNELTWSQDLFIADKMWRRLMA